MSYQLLCPNGHDIDGTLERITGTAQIDLGSVRVEGAVFDFEYGGWIDVDWNSATTMQKDGEDLFVCVEGDEIKRSEVVCKEVVG